MNRENVEKWIAALEAYEGEPARRALIDDEGRLCAIGIGVQAMGIMMEQRDPYDDFYWTRIRDQFQEWTGIGMGLYNVDIPLKPCFGAYSSVAKANDMGNQTPWQIAQRLRETYLKEES